MAWVEIGLLLLLSLQFARLLWALTTPVGPLGDWRPQVVPGMSGEARAALFARLDPFYRGSTEAGPATVTALQLKLFGIRLNEASGGGSAIIATPDGVQQSIAVGGEVMPGVLLKAVALDHVVITRNGADESLFIDQSQPAPVATPQGAAPQMNFGTPAMPTPSMSAPPPPPPPPPSPVASPNVRTQIGFEPRVNNGRLNGLAVSPKGDGAAFRNAGLRPGDVVTQVDGRPVTSIADLQALETRLVPGAQIAMTVERGGQKLPLLIALPQ